MKIWHLLLSILLLTTLAWSEATISQLTSLFHEGNYEKLVVEGELLGKKLQQAGDKQGVAQVYQMLTIAYMRLGRQDDMRRCNAIAKGKFSEMNQSSGDPVARERAIAQKASSLYSSGDLEATVAYVDQQLANWPADSPRRYWVFKPKFHALWEFRDREQALQALNQETSALENVLANDPHNSKFYRANLGLTYLLGSASLAYTEPERSRQLGLKAQEHLLGPQGCGVEWLSGGPNLPFRIAAAAGRYQDAIQLSDQYLGTVYNFQTFYHSAAKARKAYWLEQLGRDREAYELYLESIEFLDGVWSNLKLRENKQTLVSRIQRGEFLPSPSMVFERAIALAVKLKDWKKALELSELYKSRSLRDALSRQELEKLNPPGLPPAVRAREQELYRQLAASPKPETVESYLQTLEQVRATNPEYADLLSGQPSKLSLPALKPGEFLVEYFGSEKEVSIFVLKPDGSIMARVVPVQRETLDQAVREARKAIKRLAFEKSLKKKLRVLSDHLIAPVEAELAGAERVIFVPHGDLHYLPFSSLLSSDGRYLVEQYEVIEAPSAHSLSFSQRKNPRRHSNFQPEQLQTRVFALGEYKVEGWSPLPGTAEEARAISQLLPKTKSYLASQLKQAQVLQDLSRGSIIHFATHGYLDHDDPLKSGLLTSDRPVTVADVLQSRLNAYSVFLSACDTAMGEQTGADEIVGLQQSFLYAGTPSVIASLWQVSDEATAELVSNYYSNLKTEPKGQALREAQLTMLGNNKHSHPYFWSAFILSGDWI